MRASIGARQSGQRARIPGACEASACARKHSAWNVCLHGVATQSSASGARQMGQSSSTGCVGLASSERAFAACVDGENMERRGRSLFALRKTLAPKKFRASRKALRVPMVRDRP
eukprot:6182686-Pleurochrysis_carterae.AAC.1